VGGVCHRQHRYQKNRRYWEFCFPIRRQSRHFHLSDPGKMVDVVAANLDQQCNAVIELMTETIPACGVRRGGKRGVSELIQPPRESCISHRTPENGPLAQKIR
jgi:hypothetical protein